MPQKNSWPEIEKYFSQIKRSPDSHKGQNGKVLVIGASENLVGAAGLAAMSAMAAMRTGIDLCTVATIERPGWAISSYSPDLIVRKLKGSEWSQKHLAELLKLSENADAVIIGNGMGKEKATFSLIRKFVSKCKAKLVIDADALRACSGMKFSEKPLVTPHADEFEALTGKSVEGKNTEEISEIVQECARKQNIVVLLKGKIDFISDGENVSINYTGDPGMTKGGTGDVLAGMCAGFIALGAKPFEAASAAAYINGKIGEALRKKQGYSYLASDFIAEIPKWARKVVK